MVGRGDHQSRTGRLKLICWALYEFAASPFSVLIQTFVFASYFAQHVALNEIQGSFDWGMTMGVTGLIIAVGGPILGAIADYKGDRKLWLAFFSLLCVISTALMWNVKPEISYVPLALLLVSLGTLGSEFAFIFYNAMLPELAYRKNIGTWSGIAWGLGYVGGVGCLLLALFAFLNPLGAWWSLDGYQAVPVRATFLLTAGWYALFSLPLFFFTPPSEIKKISLGEAILLGKAQLVQTIREISHYKHLFIFLIARMIYTDGLTTLFLFGGVFAAGTFHFTTYEILLFGISLNITAGVGAFVFAWLDDVIGSKLVIIISLVCLMLIASLMLLTKTLSLFWFFGLLLGLFVGPLQSSSRALIAKVTPKEKMNQVFGLYAFSGKATGFVGPLLVGLVTRLMASQRWGIATLIPFFLVGLLLVLKVPSEEQFDRYS